MTLRCCNSLSIRSSSGCSVGSPPLRIMSGKWTFSTNGVAICGMHAIPCVGMGPGFEEQAHAPDEWMPIDHLWKAAAFYAWYPTAVLRVS